MNPKILIAATVTLLGTSAALAVAYMTSPSDPFAPCRDTSMIDHAKMGGGFSLIDETGTAVTDAEVLDRPTLLYFGYTFCPDVCPLDTLRNADVLYLMEEQGLDLQGAFISVDPKRDTPAVLAEFTDAFHPTMVGLSGEAAELARLAEDYGSYFKIHDEEDDEFYLVDHTAYTFLVLPGHGVVDVIGREDLPEDVATRAACMMSKA